MPRDYSTAIGRMTEDDMREMLTQLIPQMQIYQVIEVINDVCDDNDREEMLASINPSGKS
jgi:hypothetical protein